ncbi:MAG: hypothetical protein HGB26_04890 [Desulfobulbaceae bacterium]|nr:hypothetical protein [Desulfobulbaceae bacterium]
MKKKKEQAAVASLFVEQSFYSFGTHQLVLRLSFVFFGELFALPKL